VVLIRRRWQVHPPLVGAPPPARSAPGRGENPACRGCGHAWVGQVVESGRSVAGALVHRLMRPEGAAGEDALVRASPLLRMVPVGGAISPRRMPMAHRSGFIFMLAPDDRSGRTTASGGRRSKRDWAGYSGHRSPVQSSHLPLTELAIFGAASLWIELYAVREC
jgi:hypothetical protein